MPHESGPFVAQEQSTRHERENGKSWTRSSARVSRRAYGVSSIVPSDSELSPLITEIAKWQSSNACRRVSKSAEISHSRRDERGNRAFLNRTPSNQALYCAISQCCQQANRIRMVRAAWLLPIPTRNAGQILLCPRRRVNHPKVAICVATSVVAESFCGPPRAEASWTIHGEWTNFCHCSRLLPGKRCPSSRRRVA